MEGSPGERIAPSTTATPYDRDVLLEVLSCRARDTSARPGMGAGIPGWPLVTPPARHSLAAALLDSWKLSL